MRNRLRFRLSGVLVLGRCCSGTCCRPVRRRGRVPSRRSAGRTRCRAGVGGPRRCRCWSSSPSSIRSVRFWGCNEDAVVRRGACRSSSTSISPAGTREAFRCRLARMIRDEARLFLTRSVACTIQRALSALRYFPVPRDYDLRAPRAVTTPFGKPDMPPFAHKLLAVPVNPVEEISNL